MYYFDKTLKIKFEKKLCSRPVTLRVKDFLNPYDRIIPILKNSTQTVVTFIIRKIQIHTKNTLKK